MDIVQQKKEIIFIKDTYHKDLNMEKEFIILKINKLKADGNTEYQKERLK